MRTRAAFLRARGRPPVVGFVFWTTFAAALAALGNLRRWSIHNEKLARDFILDRRGVDFGFSRMGPSFDRDAIFERNSARYLFRRAWRKPHFRSIVQPQAVGFSLRILGELRYNTALSGGALGGPALSTVIAARTFSPR
jgi:hypothetical protein